MSEYTPKHNEESPAPKKANKIIYYVIMAACLVVMLGAIVYLCFPSLFESGNKPTDEFKTSSTEEVVETELPQNPIDFKTLQEKYPDACAWIQVDGIPEID